MPPSSPELAPAPSDASLAGAVCAQGSCLPAARTGQKGESRRRAPLVQAVGAGQREQPEVEGGRRCGCSLPCDLLGRWMLGGKACCGLSTARIPVRNDAA